MTWSYNKLIDCKLYQAELTEQMLTWESGEDPEETEWDYAEDGDWGIHHSGTRLPSHTTRRK